MGSRANSSKPHVVCVPYPAQGHINPMLKFAKLLHTRGFHVTFVNTEFNRRRLLKSRGSDSLIGLPDFRFETIPDGLPDSDADATQDIPSLCLSTSTTCLGPFRDLLKKLNDTDGVPRVSCVVGDGAMSFTVDAAEELGVPVVLFWTTSVCGFFCYTQYQSLLDKGYFPLKDMSDVTNGYLDTIIDWIPSIKGIRWRDFPSFIRTTDPNDIMFNYINGEIARAHRASAIILNSFKKLEKEVLEALAPNFPPIYTIGPLHLQINQIEDNNLKSIGSNLWKEEPECLDWLNTKEPNSVVYVNFGSITVMTHDQLVEFAWGLANSNLTFLWVIRPDLVGGDTAVIPHEFVEVTKKRSFLASWCPQEQVLNHPSIGGFLTHCGWNSNLESLCSGVPMVCWPFFAEQQTNCWYCCTHWGIGMEIDSNVKRDEVENLVKELMIGKKGKEMSSRAIEWKELAYEAIESSSGSSMLNVEELVNKVLLSHK